MLVPPLIAAAVRLMAPEGPDAEPDDSRLRAIEDRLERLEAENAKLRAQLEQPRARPARNDVRTRISRLGGSVGGYVDVGFFAATGNGTGFRADFGNVNFPEFVDVPGTWVFMGDPLATMINSRGEPADLTGSRAMRLDLVRAGDRPSFIVNALNLDLRAPLGERFSVEALVDFLPRTRDPAATESSGFGDFVDVKLAAIRYIVPTRRIDFDLYAGKVDSVLGHEYQLQEAPARLTVTPSLACRYTCGRSVGLAGRMAFLDRSLFLNLAATNGSNTQEFFGLHDEVDSNAFKTASGRLAYRLPVPVHLQAGASGAVGAQDLQNDDQVYQAQYGFDLNLRWRALELTAEYVFFHAEGGTSTDGVACDLAPCLESMVVYGLASYQITNWLVPYFRTDWRDAVHRNGENFAYVTDGLRLTPGLNLPVHPHVTLKVEYDLNLELRRVPSFPNDVFTSSMVGYF